MSDPIATPDDLGTYLGVAVDSARAALMLQLAQDKCEAIISPLPATALGVVLDVAARGYSNPQNVQQQTTGPFSVGYGAVSGGLWLTRANIADLYRLSGRSGAFTIDVMPATAGQNLPPWDSGAFYVDSDFDWPAP